MAYHGIAGRYNVINIWILAICILLVLVSARREFGGKPRRQRQQKEPAFVHNKDNKRNITVSAGDTVTLNCTVRHLGPKTVAWRKVSEDYPLSVGTEMYAQNPEMSIDYRQLGGRKTQWNLVIKKTTLEHSGTYECQITTGNPKTYHVHLTVTNRRKPIYTTTALPTTDTSENHDTKGLPIYDLITEKGGKNLDIKINGTVYVDVLNKIHLTCNITGSERPPPVIDWFHNGQKINSDDKVWRDRIEIQTNYSKNRRSLISQLKIEPSQTRDEGVYICRSYYETTSLTVHILNIRKNHTKRQVINIEGSQIINFPDKMISLTCNATGIKEAPSAAVWYHNNRRIVDTSAKWRDRTIIMESVSGPYLHSLISQLIIKRCTVEDAGRYMCRSTAESVYVYYTNGGDPMNIRYNNGGGHIVFSLIVFIFSLWFPSCS